MAHIPEQAPAIGREPSRVKYAVIITIYKRTPSILRPRQQHRYTFFYYIAHHYVIYPRPWLCVFFFLKVFGTSLGGLWNPTYAANTYRIRVIRN